jgi:hypothetical protein
LFLTQNLFAMQLREPTNQPAERIVCLTATGIDGLIELGLEPVGYLSQSIADRPEFYGDRAHQFTYPEWFA